MSYVTKSGMHRRSLKTEARPVNFNVAKYEKLIDKGFRFYIVMIL
jgi:hypothetical protein